MLLIEPTTEYSGQIQAYRKEFLDCGDSMDGTSHLRRFEDPEKWIEYCRLSKEPEKIPEGVVPATQYIFVREEDDKIVGMLQIRHCFNAYLEKYGGHIGYSVVPSERHKGYASQMLKLALPKCRELGMENVLITCIEDNIGSRKTILANGGEYESTVYEPEAKVNLERYWIDLSKWQRDFEGCPTMYLSSDQLIKRIQEISKEAELVSNQALSFEEYIALPFFGQIILRFVLHADEFTLDDLDRYEKLLNDIVGKEFMADFMGSVYVKVGVDYSALDQRLSETKEQFEDVEIQDSIHAESIRKDAVTLLRTAGLDISIPVWEIQVEEDGYTLLLFGKDNKKLFTLDEPTKISVMEVDGEQAANLIKAAFHCKKNGISLARVLSK